MTLPRFVPVIFANGIDDDAPGLQAAIDDKPVQYGRRIYEAGENILISDVALQINQDVVDFGLVESRTVLIEDCRIQIADGVKFLGRDLGGWVAME